MNFNQIPVNLLTPGAYVEFDNSKAIRGLIAMQSRILLIAPMLASGAAVADVPFQLASKSDAVAKLGRGSVGADMVDALFAVTNTIEAWVLPVADNGAGVAAQGTVTITGTVSAAGTLCTYIAGRRIDVAAGSGATAGVMGDALATAINAEADLPLTASASSGVVTLTCRHKGTLGNDIDLRVNYYPLEEKTPAGLAITIAAMGATTLGATNPSIATGLAAIGSTQYSTVICPWTDGSNMALLEAELTTRWGPLYQNDGHGHVAVRGTVGELNTWGSSRNSPHITAWSIEAGGSPTAIWRLAALAGTASAYYLSIDPARPLQTIQLPTMLPAAADKRFTRAERNNVLGYGLATTIVDAGGNVQIERAVTTYTTNAGGSPDPSYRDIETMATLSYLRYTLRARILQKFPRCKLASDGIQTSDTTIVTPSIIRDEVIALFLDWEAAGLVEGFEQFKADLAVARNGMDVNRVDVILPPDLMNQFRVFAGQIQFLL